MRVLTLPIGKTAEYTLVDKGVAKTFRAPKATDNSIIVSTHGILHGIPQLEKSGTPGRRAVWSFNNMSAADEAVITSLQPAAVWSSQLPKDWVPEPAEG